MSIAAAQPLERSTATPDLLVFADDWGRHPSSCQHLVGQILGRRHVCWVNTIATRAPGWGWDTFRRGFEKLRHWMGRGRPAEPPPAGLKVVNPRMWPWMRSSFDRRINRGLLLRQLRPVVGVPHGAECAVALTTLPIVADLMGRLPVRRWVYYCVDDFTSWPGLDGSALLRLEEIVIRKADVVVAVSRTLQDKMAAHGRAAELLTHGVDLDFWANGVQAPDIPQLDGLQRPLIVFWGLIDRRMDTAWVAALAAKLDRGTIVLAGPEADPDPALLALPRMVRTGSLPFPALPRLAQEAAVLVMPYADLPVTRFMQPLKFKEYLASGNPVVARALPATADWHDAADLAETPEKFVQAVCERLQTGLPPAQREARQRLTEESWQAKARTLENLIWPQETAARATANV
jgi:glycosyltransferase involved in cell wall biosynthesis